MMRDVFYLLVLTSIVVVTSGPNIAQNAVKNRKNTYETVADAATMRRRFATLALSCVHREFPNKIAHVLSSDADIRAPRHLTPAFYGCFDWHSAVHGHWLLARLARIDTNLSMECRQALGKSLTQEKLQGELAYVGNEQRPSFERPYGLAWFLQLVMELDEWAQEEKQDAREIQQWRENLRPLETLIVARLSAWLPKLSYPIRSGEHSQTAFALGLLLDYARRMSNTEFAELIERRSRVYFAADKNYPFVYEPSGEDFLSAGLAEADLMRRVMSNQPQNFAQWFNQLLPADTLPTSLEPPSIADPTDPKLIHLAGLCLSRAWMLEGVAGTLSSDANQRDRRDQLMKLSERNAEAGLIAIDENHYEGGHWLGTFAVYYLTRRGLTNAYYFTEETVQNKLFLQCDDDDDVIIGQLFATHQDVSLRSIFNCQ